MKRPNRLLGALALGAALAISCNKGAEPAAAPAAAPTLDPAARQAEWRWLQETKKAIDLKREEIASLQDQAAIGAVVGPQIDALNQQIAKLGAEFGQRLIDYVNADPPLAGQPLRPEQLAAVRLKSADDIQVAKEFIEQTGDYEKAVGILNRARALDPENSDLRAALDDAQTMRYMTADRFAAVKRGMSAAEVSKLLGRPSPKHVRDFPERKVILWYYPKNEAGEAAGVYFNADRIVYSVDFDAVKRGDG